MNILIAINSAYIEPAKVMLYSLAVHNLEHLSVYLLYSDIKKRELQKLGVFITKRCHGKLYPLVLDKHIFDKYPIRGHFSRETYYRIYAQYLLPENIERILWLDADIVVTNTLKEFYERDFEGNCLIACENISDANEESVKRLKLKYNRYFNAGVILMNLGQMREEIKEEELGKLIDENISLFLWQDQDILNIVYQDSVLFDKKRFNCQMGGGREYRLEEIENAAVLHYVGGRKPWNYYCMENEKQYYLPYMKRVSVVWYFKVMLFSKLYKIMKGKK